MSVSYWDALRAPVEPMPDIPIQRDSVSAMSLVHEVAEMPFKPYVYRGTGEDRHPEWDLSLPAEPKPKPKPKFKAGPDMPAERVREVARMKYRAKQRARERWAQRQVPLPKPHPVPLPEVDQHEPPNLYPVRRIWAAAGWRPMTGADIEALLEEME